MWNQSWGTFSGSALQPPLPNTNQAMPMQPPLPSEPPPATAVPYAAAATAAPAAMTSPYGQYTAAQYATLTAEQQFAIQQHWQQWQTYQQEYAKWHAQYGDQYNREVAAAAAAAASYQPALPTAPQPPPEVAAAPATVATPQVVKITGAATMYNTPPLVVDQKFPSATNPSAQQNQANSTWQQQNQANPTWQQQNEGNSNWQQQNQGNTSWQQQQQQQPPPPQQQNQVNPSWQQQQPPLPPPPPQQQQQQQQQQQFQQPRQQQHQANNNNNNNQRWDKDEDCGEGDFYMDQPQNNSSFNKNNNNMNDRNNQGPKNNNNNNNRNNNNRNNSFNERSQNFSPANRRDNQRGWLNENQNNNNNNNNKNMNRGGNMNDSWSSNNDNRNNNNNNNFNQKSWGNNRNDGNDRNFGGNNKNRNNNNFNNNNMGKRDNRNQGNMGNMGNNNFRQGSMNHPPQKNNQSFMPDRNLNQQQQRNHPFQQGSPSNLQQQQQQQQQQRQNQSFPSMNRPNQGNAPLSIDRGPNNGQQQNNPKPIPVEMTEEIFDRQFRQWEEQFEEWKRTNANSTDREMYERCATQFETQRKRLMERRDQMRRRKLEQLQVQQNVQIVPPSHVPNPPDDIPKPTENTEVAEPTVPTEKALESEDNLKDDKPEETTTVPNSYGMKRPNNFESDCSEPKSLKTEEDPIPVINLDEDENEKEKDDGGDNQPIAGIFNKSGDIPGLDLVDDTNTSIPEEKDKTAEEKLKEMPKATSFLSENKEAKPEELEKPAEISQLTVEQNLAADKVLTQQIQDSSVGNLPIVLEALRDPETLKNILQVLAKVKGLSQHEIGNRGAAPSEQVLQELPGLLQKLQNQRTTVSNIEDNAQNKTGNVQDTGDVSFAEWQRRKAMNQGGLPQRNVNFNDFSQNQGNFGIGPNFIKFDDPLSGAPNMNNMPNNMNNPYDLNRNAGNFASDDFGDEDNMSGPGPDMDNRRFGPGPNNFVGQQSNFGGGRPSFDGPGSRFANDGPNFDGPGSRFGNDGPNFDGPGSRFGNDGPNFDGPGSRFGNDGPNFDGPGSRFGNDGPNFDGRGSKFDDDGPYFEGPGPASRFGGPPNDFNNGRNNRNFGNPRQRGNMNRANPFRQNIGARNFNNQAGPQNNEFNANRPWKTGGHHKESSDDFFQPVKVIEYENTSTATKVFDFTRRAPQSNLKPTPDDYMPIKTIDYGHSSGQKPIVGPTNSHNPGNFGFGPSVRGKKKKRRGSGKNRMKQMFTGPRANDNEKNESNPIEVKQNVTENTEENPEQPQAAEHQSSQEGQAENENQGESQQEAKGDENPSEDTNTNENQIDTELEQISDTEDNMQNDSPDRMDNDSPAPPPPPIFSLPALPPIVNTPLFPSVMDVKIANKSTKDSHSVQLLYPSEENKNTITIDEILLNPGRSTRPRKVCIIMRGPPGSGKSHVAKLIKDKEMEMGGKNIRLLSIDDYFMIENDYEEKCPKTGKKLMKKEILYEYDEASEETYMQYLIKSFKKTILDKLYDFIIVDCNNNSLRTLNEFYCHAKDSGFVPYIIDLFCDVETCLNRNRHERSENDIRKIIDTWKTTPFHYIKLDVSSLLENVIEMEDAENMALENDNAEGENSQEGDASAQDLQEDDSQESESNCGFLKSKWETELNQTEKLARLDGICKSLSKRKATMEDYLQLEDWQPPTAAVGSNGKKRVRWADIEESRAQEKMREIGFVVGQTDWKRMMDPNAGNRALNKTKYI